MRRREFLSVLSGAAAVAWPLAVRAQQGAMPVIGFLHPSTPGVYSLNGLRQGLKEAGFIEGQNLTIEYRWANNEPDRVPELAADLVRRRVAVIVVLASTAAALTAKEATATAPIVFGSGADPVEAGLVASINRPGGNVTGATSMSGELVSKQLGLLHELVPKARRFAVLISPFTVAVDRFVNDMRAAAAVLGRQIDFFN